ncbi:tetratricopeptide repeat protein [Nisaea sp.]|uniref:tetratricopeptide repeat protein n=1 Tax=Nisaea sp. TaxID=2024842 RepID=UPI002B26EF36|nr:tetratricopeptide repeat protein [Nisaea sp.]
MLLFRIFGCFIATLLLSGCVTNQQSRSSTSDINQMLATISAAEAQHERGSKTARQAYQQLHQAQVLGLKGQMQAADSLILESLTTLDQSELPPLNKSQALIKAAGILWTMGYRSASRDVARRAAHLAEAMVRLDDPKNAKNPFVYQLRRSIADPYVRLGRVERALGNHDAARHAFARAVEILPEDSAASNPAPGVVKTEKTEPLLVESLTGLARAEVALGDLEPARTHALKAISIAEREGLDVPRAEAKIAFSEAARDLKALNDALGEFASVKKGYGNYDAAQGFLRLAWFHSAGSSLKAKKRGLTMAEAAAVMVEASDLRMEASRVALEIADEIRELDPDALTEKDLYVLKDVGRVYGVLSSKLLKYADRLSPVQWPALAQ